MIVIDTSALSKYLLKEEGWRSVREYLALGCYSVDLITKEVVNVIWKHFILLKSVDENTADTIYSLLKKLIANQVIEIESGELYLDSAYQISKKYKIPIYDSLYIAQAKEKGELLTGDKVQASVAEKNGVKIHLV